MLLYVHLEKRCCAYNHMKKKFKQGMSLLIKSYEQQKTIRHSSNVLSQNKTSKYFSFSYFASLKLVLKKYTWEKKKLFW